MERLKNKEKLHEGTDAISVTAGLLMKLIIERPSSSVTYETMNSVVNSVRTVADTQLTAYYEELVDLAKAICSMSVPVKDNRRAIQALYGSLLYLIEEGTKRG